MATTTLTLDDATQRRLEELAAVRGVTPEEIIREALDEKLAPVRRRMPKSLGMGDSGRTDISERMSTEAPEFHRSDTRRKNMPRSIGIADSGYRDTSERASKPLFELDCSDVV